MAETSKPVYILYGSQTGNAESIAKDYAQVLLEENGIPTECKSLNEMKKIVLQDVASCSVIICSTTGNGDAPENADAFWRSIKLRRAPKDKFQGSNFCVLGM